MSKKYSDEIVTLLKTVYDNCDQEDVAVRERQIRQWRRLKLLWEGFQHVWYSEVAHDWRIWDASQEQDSDQASYDKPINVFKAYLETIIAALSVTVPPIKCYPDDADNTLDLATAKAGDKISELVYRHNDVPILWLHALFILVTEGMIACYSYPKEDEKYGTYTEKKYREDTEEHETTLCSNCGYELNSQVLNTSTVPPDPNMMEGVATDGMGIAQPQPTKMTSSNNDDEMELEEKNEFMPGDDDAALHYALDSGQELCPACMMMMDPEIRKDKVIVTRLVGENQHPKSRMCMEVYGGLYVKVANYAKNQKDTPYLIFSREIDYSMAIEQYEHLNKPNLIKKIASGNSAGSYNQYAQWGRLSPQYQGEYPTNVVTVNKAWIRPAKYNILPDEEDVEKLRKNFPDGVLVTFVNDEYAEACNESLDDSWTLSENPLAEYLHFDPIGQGLVSIQEITNDLISLVLQTIEHGIGQTFADPGVVNFKAYEQTEVIPGGIFPATPKSGKSLNDGFHEIKTATLSGEVLPFSQNIQGMAQLVSGALPSLFGGQLQGSETASQYSMSRAQALQRLQNSWKLLTTWWKNIFGKVVPMYIKTVEEDERDVQQDKDGNFINVFIRKAELEGKIGKVELEASENLPLTWAQKKDVFEKLTLNANPEIQKMLAAPENMNLLQEFLGIDFFVPGEDDVIKQYDEIKLLLNSEPIETGNPEMPEVPSIEIDVMYDNHPVEFEICRKWAISPVGRQTKVDNEPGYRNVLLHGKMHFLQMQLTMQAQQQSQMTESGNGANPEKSNKSNNEAPISGDNDVQTIQ